MEGISASTEQQSASMEEITITAQKLGNLSEELKTLFDVSNQNIGNQFNNKLIQK